MPFPILNDKAASLNGSLWCGGGTEGVTGAEKLVLNTKASIHNDADADMKCGFGGLNVF